MTTLEILLSVVIGLGANEVCDVSPWLARRLARWAAHMRYRYEPERLAIRLEELDSVSRQPAGKLIQLLVALGFAVAAVGHRHKTRSRTARTSFLQPFGVRWGWGAVVVSSVPLVVALVFAFLAPFGPEPFWAHLCFWPVFSAVLVMRWRRWRQLKRDVVQRLSRLVAAGVLTRPESMKLIKLYSRHDPVSSEWLYVLMKLERAAYWVEFQRGDLAEPERLGLVMTKEMADRGVVKARRCLDYALREYDPDLL